MPTGAPSQPATDDYTRQHLLAVIPSLRAFAISLTHDSVQADDLVQDALVRAWDHRSRFEPGTNFAAWVFTILRNGYYTVQRKRRREVEDVDGQYASQLVSPPPQGGNLDIQDLQRALRKLPAAQREVLLLVAAQGLSYEEAAQVCGCAVGSVKSRVNRARHRLSELLGVAAEEVGPDESVKAVLRTAA